jgi:hypothetical protein
MPLPVQNLSDIFGPSGPGPDEGYDPSTGITRLTIHPTKVADKIDVDALAAKYGAGENKTTPKDTAAGPAPDVAALAAKYNTVTNANEAASVPGPGTPIIAGIGQGVKDVALSAAGIVTNDINDPNKDKFNEAVKSQGDQFNQQYGDSTAASIGRMGGQALATAPLLPAKGLQGIELASKALPSVVNKLGTAVGRGAAAGGVFGAATSSTNQQGLPTNIGEGTLAGAVGGPIVERTGAALSKIVPAAKQVWARFGPIQQMVNQSGAPASAIRNTIDILQNAGFTPESAQVALTKMGPKATLADLDPSLTTELSGLASLGGKPTAIAKGRMQARADTADSSASDIITKNLGPKPDIEAEKQAIYKQASAAVGPDYRAAYKSGDKLDISDLVSDIRDKLKTAVGEKEKALKTIGSYFLRKDAEGKFTNEIKDTLPELHEVREGIDAILESKNPTTSIGNKAKAVLTDARQRVDEQLKTNPQMKAADEKFAEKMKVKENLDYEWTKGNKEEFAKKFTNSTADEQQAIRKKMLADIHDNMEQASRGELAGAQQQFGKKSVNRSKLQIAFGTKADEVLDALTSEGSMRANEKGVMHGAQTAERQAVQRKYGSGPQSGYGHAIAMGLPFDLAGGHGAAAIYMAGKKYVGGRIINFSQNKLNALSEGTADLLSRQGLGRDTALSSMQRVKDIQKRVSINKKISLPAVMAPIAGQGGYESYKKITGQ